MLQIQNLIINFQAEEAHAVEDLDAAAAKAALAEVSGRKKHQKTSNEQFCRHLATILRFKCHVLLSFLFLYSKY